MHAAIRIVLALTLLAGLTACEAGKGFVQDSENLGQAVSKELNN
ncbi:hypothetical protein P775_06980 [Puniceibacterium antarcticum]|uniref:Entericidin n=1 Tax=Puniceibacterium antarcticum TaxID=1206336 RepID=A0A2G8RHL6_9RHOB|nr:hypothetical protein P775_06980 [Puniceibacterium antarcticum]